LGDEVKNETAAAVTLALSTTNRNYQNFHISVNDYTIDAPNPVFTIKFKAEEALTGVASPNHPEYVFVFSGNSFVESGTAAEVTCKFRKNAGTEAD
jgi:hypothetical protein